MQLRRLAFSAALLAAVLPAVPSHAAVRLPRACNLITDTSGDGSVLGLKTDTLDILGADISSGPKEVTGVLHLKSAAVENDPYLKGGAIYNVNFTVGNIKYTFYATWPTVVTPNPTLTGGLTAGNNESTPKATFTRKGNDFVWTVSRAAIPTIAKPKQYFYPTNASTGADSMGTADQGWAKANAKYQDKQPSCLASK